MESDTINAEVEPATFASFQQSVRTFAVMAEAAYHSLQNWEKSLDTKLNAAEHLIDSRLHDIQATLQHFQETLQATQVQEWQKTVETIYIDERLHSQLLQETYNDIKKSMQQIASSYERTAAQTTKKLTQTLHGLHAGELQQLADDSCEEVKTLAATIKQQVTQTIAWFNWKNFSIVFLLALLVSVVISLYIDDEWPWEAHKIVVKQRIAGQMLIAAWPQLNHNTQQQIMNGFA